jgi:hypothetical protein
MPIFKMIDLKRNADSSVLGHHIGRHLNGLGPIPQVICFFVR